MIRIDSYLTGALASDGVVEGAVEEAGVRIVLLGATPWRAQRSLCLWPDNDNMLRAMILYRMANLNCWVTLVQH